MRFWILWDRENLQMSKWLPPTLLWVLCAVLWLVVAVDRSSAVNTPVDTVVNEPSDTSITRDSTGSEPDTAVHEKAVTGEQCINVNKATADELDVLPGVGPVIAQRIIEYRNRFGPFATLKDLQKVKGIGPATAKKIGPQTCF